MGNATCCSSTKHTNLSGYIGSEISKCIERNDIKHLGRLLSILPNQDLNLDSEIIIIKKVTLNPLTYALLTGKDKIFKFIYDKGADLSIMDRILNSFNVKAIDIICERGYLDLLQYYLPIYLKSFRDSPNSPEIPEQTLNFASSIETNAQNVLTPAQRACDKGHISIITYLYKYFKSKKFVPRLFDLDYPSEKTGETCALIACRKGNYALIKVLHTICNVDFNVHNRYDENAIIICVCAYRIEKNPSYLDCIKYLIEKVGLDISYMHEEILILSECEELIYYIEQKLQDKNIIVTKAEIDEKYNIKRHKPSDSYEACDSNEFFSSTLRRYLDDGDSSRVSTISQISSKSDLIYASIFAPNY
ncbi:hypothetical protein SteCoe_23069 [Stentor coeruleus]|uniref:Uncharacterized protein n=1 Tax=Stentor coeruleus TaxID=5963 RepID=A0A1R2BKZ7_9CILI|nr:hypothetical protein SteCoe_23069 [Stentor coeruleus]